MRKILRILLMNLAFFNSIFIEAYHNVNAVPIAVDDKLGTTRPSFIVDILRNDTYTAPILQIKIHEQPKYGILTTDSQNRYLTFTRTNSNFITLDYFTYSIVTADGESQIARVNLQLNKGSEKGIVYWQKDYKGYGIQPEIETFDVNVAAGISISQEIKTISGVDYPAYKIQGFPTNSDNAGAVDKNKYIQFGFRLKPNEMYTTELRKMIYHFSPSGLGSVAVSFSRDPNFTTIEGDFSITGSVGTWKTTDLDKLIRFDSSFRRYIQGSTSDWYNPYLYPGDEIYVRIYFYNTASANMPIYILYNDNSAQSLSLGPVINAVVNDYYPEKCTSQVVWQNGLWEDNKQPKINQVVVLKDNYDTSVSGSFEACSLRVEADKKLNITANKYVVVQQDIVNDGEITVQSDGNLVQKNDNELNTGTQIDKVKVFRNSRLKRLDYNYWSSPVALQNLRNFSSGTLTTRFYVYNESNDYFDGIFVKNKYPSGELSLTPLENPSTYTFLPGRGYAIRSSNSFPSTITNFSGAFVGNPNNGVYEVSIKKSANEVVNGVTYEHGNNLIGNPYASNFDFDLLYQKNSDLIYNTAYFWTNTNYNPQMQGAEYPKEGIVNNYAIYNGTGGVPAPYSLVGSSGNCSSFTTPKNIIKVGQGMIVKAKKEGLLKFNNEIRSISNNGVFINFTECSAPSTFRTNTNLSNDEDGEISKDRFWLNLKTPLDFVSPILIGYIPGATNDYEMDFDSPLLVNGADSFYSVQGNKKLGIQGKQHPFNVADKVQLGAKFYQSGVYEISLSNREGIFINNLSIFLTDHLTGISVDLTKEIYTFNAEKGEDTTRFEISYLPQSNLSAASESHSEVQIYKNANHAVVSGNENLSMLRVYDISGKLVFSHSKAGKNISIPLQKLPLGILVFTYQNHGRLESKKWYH